MDVDSHGDHGVVASRTAWGRQEPTAWLLRPSLSKKLGLFFALFLGTMAANGLVFRAMLDELDGMSATVNVAGSLRWLSQKAQVETLRVALDLGGTRRDMRAEMERFDKALSVLEKGGSIAGVPVAPLPPAQRAMIDKVREQWEDYRADVEQVFDRLESKRPATAELNHLYEDSARIVGLADAMTLSLTQQLGAAETTAVRRLYALGLLDLGLMIVGILAVRAWVVRPLRRLAEVSRRFAAGRYQERARLSSRDEIGQLAGDFDHLADVTERHIQRIAADMAEIQRVGQSLRKLSEAVEHSPVSVVITDANGTIEYVNPKFTEVTAYSYGECIGGNPRLLKSGTTPTAVYESLWRTICGGRPWRGELQNRKKSGELFWEDTRISPLKNDQGEITHFIAVKEDITERKLAEDEIRRLNADLERRVAERTRQLQASNRELEAFSYSVSHDLRAPLRAINGFAQLMMEKCSDCPDREALTYLQRIQRGSLRMGELIDDLLDLSRLARSEVQAEAVDLSEMARSVGAELASGSPQRRVSVDIASGISACGDPRLLRIVLENLLGNAWKFSARAEDAHIVFGCREENGEQILFVADNGAGFEQKYAHKLFAPFSRLHRADEFEGTGVGLATVQRIIQLHGGRIWAAGEPGRGAVFSFVLPRRDDAGPARSGAA